MLEVDKFGKSKFCKFWVPINDDDEFVSAKTKESSSANEFVSSEAQEPCVGNESDSSKSEEPQIEVKDGEKLTNPRIARLG
ncbi:hypothetical protein Hanom_Chr07g00625871 [Helianthus anomalus]